MNTYLEPAKELPVYGEFDVIVVGGEMCIRDRAVRETVKLKDSDLLPHVQSHK